MRGNRKKCSVNLLNLILKVSLQNLYCFAVFKLVKIKKKKNQSKSFEKPVIRRKIILFYKIGRN